MSIRESFEYLLEEYPKATERDFADHALANFIRNEIPKQVRAIIDLDDRYFAYGSAGQGVWARVPWVAVFDRLITDTARSGYYIVCLFKEDCSGMYISLNQGITSVRDIYGADAKKAILARAGDLLARLEKTSENHVTGKLDLAVKNSSGLGAFYECGSIIAKYYEKGSVPSDEQVNKDLKEFLNYYFTLASKDLLANTNSEEDDEKDLGYEDLSALREHKRIERNKKLAEEAKKIHGYVCQCCEFDFEKKYGEIGKDFIEAHHLTPLSTLKGQKVKLSPEKDFAVLCSNCHRMIHKTEFVSKVSEFKAKYLISSV